MSTRCCSFCLNSGHNIRGCTDPSIWNLWRTLVSTFVIPRLGSSFTETDKWTVTGFIACNYDSRVTRATAIKYTKTNYGLSGHVTDCYRLNLYDRLVSELQYVNMLDDISREWWSLGFVDESIFESRTDLDAMIFPDSSSFNPVIHVVSSSLISATAVELTRLTECVICQEDMPMIDFNTTNCGHSFCHTCICRHIQSKGSVRANCPLCRTEITHLQTREVVNLEELDNLFQQVVR